MFKILVESLLLKTKDGASRVFLCYIHLGINIANFSGRNVPISICYPQKINLHPFQIKV